MKDSNIEKARKMIEKILYITIATSVSGTLEERIKRIDELLSEE